jgi:hypothetical protein
MFGISSATIEDRLDALARELARSNESYAGLFRPVASGWRQVIAAQVHELAQAVESRQEIDSPYVIGIPLSDRQEIFVGRTEFVTARIEQLLLDRRRPPLLLYGQQRMGKTSLLNNLGRLLPSGIVPLFVDLQGAPAQASDHAGLLYNISRRTVSSAEQHRSLHLPALSRESLATAATIFIQLLQMVVSRTDQAKFATGKRLKLTVSVEIAPEKGVSSQQSEEIKIGLRELGLNDDVREGWPGGHMPIQHIVTLYLSPYLSQDRIRADIMISWPGRSVRSSLLNRCCWDLYYPQR